MVCSIPVGAYQVLGSFHSSLIVVEDLLTTVDPLLTPLAVELLTPEEVLVTEELPLVVDLLDPVALLVTVVLLVNDFVTVDVAVLEDKVGPGVRTDSVDTYPPLTEV